ncbi:glycosyltransferase family 4 protein [Weissella confusa]
MKIMMIVSSLAATGPGNVVRDIANGLEDKHEVTVLSLSDADFDEISLNQRIKLVQMHVDNGKVPRTTIDWIQKFVNDYQPDIVYSTGIRADYISTQLKNKNSKYVTTSHNNPFQDYTGQYGILRGTILAVVQFSLFRKMDFVVTLNPSLKKMHSLIVGKRKIGLISNGVPEYSLLEPHGVPYRFGVVGSFIKRKNQKFIVDNFIREGIDDVIFWGEGPELSYLSKLAKKTKIKFAGFEKRQSIISSSFETLISASKSEGMPLNVLEALSAGKKAVLSDIPAHRYIFDQMPNGAVFLFHNRIEFNEAIRRSALDGLDSNSIQVAARKAFSVEKMVDSYDRLFTGLN